MLKPIENAPTVKNSSKVQTTVTLTEDFFIKFEKIKTYDEEYCIVVTNLL